MVFNAVLNSISLIWVFLSIHSNSFLPVLHTIFVPSLWLLSYITIVETIDKWERNVSCGNDYHQSLDKMLAELEIEPKISCSQVLYATDSNWARSMCTWSDYVLIKEELFLPVEKYSHQSGTTKSWWCKNRIFFHLCLHLSLAKQSSSLCWH